MHFVVVVATATTIHEARNREMGLDRQCNLRFVRRVTPQQERNKCRVASHGSGAVSTAADLTR